MNSENKNECETLYWDYVYSQKSKQTETYLAFIYLEKAFENLDWNLMINEINKIGINQLDIRIIYNLYRNQQANIKHGNLESIKSKIKKETEKEARYRLQVLFNYYIDKIINIAKGKLSSMKLK